MNSSVFWDITSHNLLKDNWCFRGSCRLYFQVWRASQVRIQHETGSQDEGEMSVDFQRTIWCYIPLLWEPQIIHIIWNVCCLEKLYRLNLCDHNSISEGILYNPHTIQTCTIGCSLCSLHSVIFVNFLINCNICCFTMPNELLWLQNNTDSGESKGIIKWKLKKKL